LIEQLKDTVCAAIATKTKLRISGNNSKDFLQTPFIGYAESVSLTSHSGIIDYKPAELFITVKSGTKLARINKVLARQGQFLGFIPPDYGNSTAGGTVACALSGSTRPYLGALRDHILGLKLINGRGKLLKFGGQMIKNVAGFDITRLLCGSRGKLGIITEISFKTLPLPAIDHSFKLPSSNPVLDMQKLMTKNSPPISCAYTDGHLYVRTTGTKIYGKEIANDIWKSFNPFSCDLKPGQYLWRLSIEANAKVASSTIAIDWGGVRRWLVTESTVDPYPNGKSILWQGATTAYFAQKSQTMSRLEDKIRRAFDPHGVFV